MSTAATRWIAALALTTVTIAPARAQPADAALLEAINDAAVRSIRIPNTVVEFELARVAVDDAPDLWVLTTEVTWDLYDVYLYALDVPQGEPDADAVTRPSKPYVPPDRGMGHAGFPAIGMTRHAAESFCAWLETRTGLAARLPTPEEFEHLARTANPDHAWTSVNSARTTHGVAQLDPNEFGLHDMLGNVAEWVAGDGKPVAMGGSYLDPPTDCTPDAAQRQARAWNQSDPQIPKSRWWLADCSWVGFRFVVEDEEDSDE